MKRKSSLQEPKVLLNFLILNTLIAVFFATLPDLWSVLIMLWTSMLMGMYVGINIKHILSAIIVGLSGVGLALRWSISINNNYCKDQTIESRPWFCKYSYLVNRFEVFIDPSSDASGQWVSWQGRQALISIGWGWFRGRWYGKWLQKFGYIPEAQSDFIFSAYAEEVGFIWIFILFLLYSLLVYIVLSRVHLVRDPLFQYIAIGLLSLLIIEALIHMGVNLQVLPNTGITLPFVSHGSTSMLGNIVCIVLLYKILYKDYYKLY